MTACHLISRRSSREFSVHHSKFHVSNRACWHERKILIIFLQRGLDALVNVRTEFVALVMDRIPLKTVDINLHINMIDDYQSRQ